MEKETIIKNGFNDLNAGNYPAVIELFAEDAILECIYGYLKPLICFQFFLNDTAASNIVIHKIMQDPTDNHNIIADLEFTWTLNDGLTVTGHAVETFIFNSENKIAYVRTKYSFAGLL
jgi:hypothetical protein